MNDIPLAVLFAILIALFMLSAFFSGSETALMALNRYRLRHLAENQRGAKLALRLLENPDRLIGIILLGNNLINILITQLATYIGYRVAGSSGVAIATGMLTFLLLIFAEVAPKTIAASKSEMIAFPASYVFTPLLKFAYPLVWLINLVANGLVKLVGIDLNNGNQNALNSEELKVVVNEAGGMLPKSHQDMLLRILELEDATVEDIMVPRTEISAINLDDDWNDIEDFILRSHFTRVLVYQSKLDNIVGVLHLRDLLTLFHEDRMDLDSLMQQLSEPIYALSGTKLTQQLINFQSARMRVALVVDEWGEIQGLVTLESILEDIVGEFALTPSARSKIAMQNEDGTHWIDGSMHVRELNRQLNIDLPTDSAKTVNGLIIEHLGDIPVPGITMLINHYPIEVRTTKKNSVKSAILFPQIERGDGDEK